MTNKPESTEAQGCGMALLPCPFCGGAADMKYFNYSCQYYAECSNWKCNGKSHRLSPEEAAAQWNTRAVNQSALFERAMEALKEAEIYIRCHKTQVMPKGGVLDGKTMLKKLEAILKQSEAKNGE